MTDEEELQALRAAYPRRKLEICPSRFCRFSIRKRMAIQSLSNFGPAAIALLFAFAEPLLRRYGIPDRAIEVVVLFLLGTLWFAWIVIRGGGRTAMDVIALLQAGLTGGSKNVDIEPVFDRADARAQLDAFLDELERSRYTGTVPIQFKGGEPRRITAIEELDLSMPSPIGGRESKEVPRPK